MLDRVETGIVNNTTRPQPQDKPEAKIPPQTETAAGGNSKLGELRLAGLVNRANFEARYVPATQTPPPPTPAEALEQIEALPTPDPNDPEAVRAYKAERAEIAQSALDNAQPPRREDYQGPNGRTAEYEYREAKSYYDGQISELRRIVADQPLSEAEADRRASDLLERYGGRDDFDHQGAGRELAALALESPSVARSITDQLLAKIKDGDRDEVMQDLVESLSVSDLTKLAQDPDGRGLLLTTQRELEVGTHGDENETLKKIDFALDSPQVAGNQQADIDQMASDIEAIYEAGDRKDAAAALAAALNRLDEVYGYGTGSELIRKLNEDDPWTLTGVLEAAGNPDVGVSEWDTQDIARNVDRYYQSLSPDQRIAFENQLSSSVFPDIGDRNRSTALARFISHCDSDLKTGFARGIFEQVTDSNDPFNKDLLLGMAGIAIANDPEATANIIQYLKTHELDHYQAGDGSLGRFMQALAGTDSASGTDRSVLADFLDSVGIASSQDRITPEEVGNILQTLTQDLGFIDSGGWYQDKLLDSAGVKAAVAGLFSDASDPETIAGYLNTLGPEATLALEQQLKDDPNTAGAIRDGLAAASQAGLLSSDFIQQLVDRADFATLERLTSNSSSPLTDDFLVRIGNEVRDRGIEREMIVSTFPVEVRFANDHADAILGNIAKSSKTASNTLLQDRSFVRFALELNIVSARGQDKLGVQAILRAGTDSSLRDPNMPFGGDRVDSALSTIADVLSDPASFDYPGLHPSSSSREKVVEPEIAQTLAEIYQDNALAFAHAASASNSSFGESDVRNFLHVILQHQDETYEGQMTLGDYVQNTVEAQVAFYLTQATLGGPSGPNRDSSGDIVGSLLAVYSDERARDITDDAARRDAEAQFRNDLLTEAIQAVPNFFKLNPIAAGTAGVVANDFSVFLNAALAPHNLDQAVTQLNLEQISNGGDLKLSVLQAYFESARAAGGPNAPNGLGDFYRSMVAYDQALKQAGHVGILRDGSLILDNQQAIDDLLYLAGPDSNQPNRPGQAQANAIFRVVNPLYNEVTSKREDVQQDN